jgi:hypothetical protein
MEPTMAKQPNTTLETVSDYITDGRTLLLDTIYPYRYDDASLLVALNVSLLEGRRVRPDLFVFCGDTIPSFYANDNSIVPIEKQFRLAFLHGMVGHALERDQEDVQDARSQAFLLYMSNLLIGKKIISPSTTPGD